MSARFPGEGKRVLFSYLPPGEKKARFALPKRDECGTHSYLIDTAGFRPGKGWWYFRSYDEDVELRRAKSGSFLVSSIPRTLLEPVSKDSFSSGLDSLGCYYVPKDFIGGIVGFFKRPKPA